MAAVVCDQPEVDNEGFAMPTETFCNGWLTAKQAAAALSVSTKTLHVWCRKRKIAHRWKNAMGQGGTVLIHASEIERIIAADTIRPEEAIPVKLVPARRPTKPAYVPKNITLR